MSTTPGEPTEQELLEMRAAYEAELARITVGDVVIQTAVTLVNLAGWRLGGGPGAEAEADLEQVRDAIDAVRGLLPVLERRAEPELRALRDALSQIQMAYAREVAAAPVGAGPEVPGLGASAARAGAGAGGDGPAAERPAGATDATAGPAADGDPKQGPGPAQSSGRLWVPGR